MEGLSYNDTNKIPIKTIIDAAIKLPVILSPSNKYDQINVKSG